MTSCTQCLALERIVLNGEERRATCSECGAVVERVQRRASTASARVLLAALGHELPGLTGRAVAYGERVAPPTPEDADAAAARSERRRTHAVEALRRLAGLWQRGERASVRALWLTFVRRGEDARIREGAGKPGGWEERLGWLLLEREERLSALLHQRRKGSGADVRAYWSAQPFDLRVHEGGGNCDACMMKGPGVLIREIRRDPSVADWWALMERRTGRRFASAYSYEDLRAVALLPAERLTGRAKALAENTDAAMPCACTD